MQLQSVYYGDCAQHLEQWSAHNFELLKSARSLADLIYLDPPWNSNRIYNITVDKGDNANKGFTAQATEELGKQHRHHLLLHQKRQLQTQTVSSANRRREKEEVQPHR